MFNNKQRKQQKQQAKASLQKLVRKTVQDTKQNSNRSRSNLRNFINDKTVKNQMQIQKLLMSNGSHKSKQKVISISKGKYNKSKQKKEHVKSQFTEEQNTNSKLAQKKKKILHFNNATTEPCNLSISVEQFNISASLIDNDSYKKNQQSQSNILKSINNIIDMAQETPRMLNQQISFEKKKNTCSQRKYQSCKKDHVSQKNNTKNHLCKNCQSIQSLYREEISMIRKYCDYVKQENKKLREKLYRLPQQFDAIEDQQLSDKNSQKYLKLLLKNQKCHTQHDLQEQIGNIVDQRDNLIKQLQRAKQSIQRMAKQLKLQVDNNQKAKNQLKTKNFEIQALEEEISSLKRFKAEKQRQCQSLRTQNQNLEQSGCNTEIYNQTIEEIMKMNDRLLQENRCLRQQKNQIQQLCQQISERSIEESSFESNKQAPYQKYNQLSFHELFSQSSIDIIKKAMLAKIQLNTKPLEEEIQLLKQVFQGQKRKFQQRQVHLKTLLLNAQQTIKGLMQELRNTKKQAKNQFLNNLIKQRANYGLKSQYGLQQYEERGESTKQ